jgi:uncharacterized protein (TIGR03435 family)
MIRILSIATLLISAAPGQPSPAFDVASVRSAKVGIEGGRRENIQVNPGTLTMRNVSLKSALRWAYHVMDYQVSGPDWIGFDRFDISAKASDPVAEDQLRLMLQALLVERFKITLHRVTKEMQAYDLVIAKGGIKFHESQVEGEPIMNPDKNRMSMEIKGLSATQFIDALSNVLRAPVINHTGLTGKYDAAINVAKYMPDVSKADSSGAPFDPTGMIITALQDDLGLKLESKKMPIDLLIIDHAEKIPADN